MDEYQVWYRHLMSTLVTQHLQHNPHLLSAAYYMMAKPNHKHDGFVADHLVHIYGVVFKPCIINMKRK